MRQYTSMLQPSILDISSPDNPKLKRIRRFVKDNQAYRKLGTVWLEGEHLCQAYLKSLGAPANRSVAMGRKDPIQIFFARSAEHAFMIWWAQCLESMQNQEDTVAAVQVHRVDDALMHALSSLDTPCAIGMWVGIHLASQEEGLLALQAHSGAFDTRPTIVLDRLQDPGNVGSILRTAAALGYHRVVALKGTAALYSAKVLRAGMGAHFSLELLEGIDKQTVLEMGWSLAVTSSHRGQWLHTSRLPQEAVWVFGHEGQGVDPSLEQASLYQIRIAQPGGQESLNVAAAAAICLYSHVIYGACPEAAL